MKGWAAYIVAYVAVRWWERQRRTERRLSELEQEWRAFGLAAEQAAAQIEHLDLSSYIREEGAL